MQLLLVAVVLVHQVLQLLAVVERVDILLVGLIFQIQ
jgi:hypothetical protein